MKARKKKLILNDKKLIRKPILFLLKKYRSILRNLLKFLYIGIIFLIFDDNFRIVEIPLNTVNPNKTHLA